MAEPDYSKMIQRILDLLQTDNEFAKKISEFRFGELPEQTDANSYPACYVTTSTKPEIKRDVMGPSSGLGKIPAQQITTEFWIVIISSTEETSSDTQKMLYDLRNNVISIIEKNTQLRDIDGADPLCASLELYSTERLSAQRGKMLDGITIVIRTLNYKNSPIMISS